MGLLVIGGPTAAGKTAAAVEIACRWGASLVSADAMLVYRGMDIGTARPSPAVLRRYPHAAVDLRDPDEPWTVADFLGEVRRVRATAERVVVVGGTPFYLAALVRPLTRLPPADPSVRIRLEALADPHAALADVDPVSAARLHPHDRVRLVRALEVHALTGRPISAWYAEDPARPSEGPDAPVVVWLDRDPAELDNRIEARFHRMMERGYLEEVRRLLAAGYGPEHKPMRSLGYKHLVAHLRGELPLDEAVRRSIRDTRRLARKQRTWARAMGWQPADRAAVRAAAEALWGPERRATTAHARSR